MYFSPHQVADNVINHAMPGDGVLAGKACGHDRQPVMTAIPGAGMTGMTMRLVFDLQCFRMQPRQSLAQQFERFLAQAGSTFLNGFTATCA